MSGIRLPDSRLPPSSLDPMPGQVAFEQAHGPAALLDPSLQPATPAAALQSQDVGEELLQAQAWDEEGPRQFDDESEIGAQFQALSLADAAAQAPDVIAAPLDTPVDAAA
jgi:hypothetical protein